MADRRSLLDRARRQVRGIKDPSARERLIIDLIERVQEAENEADTQAGIAAIRTAERDEARAKLDKVRERVAGAERGVARDVLAILDEEPGD
ncbi:hypothetical protein [Cellulosimicrobium funkei]|uniref:hypothetical protein n=1 Tax=Cellulosimicrobium funkei TaxID=264251 RepID=UPI0036BEF487